MKASYEAGDVDVKRQVLEIVKRRVVKDYFIIGILEQFEDTLALLETMLPMFYKGAMDAWKSDCKWILILWSILDRLCFNLATILTLHLLILFVIVGDFYLLDLTASSGFHLGTKNVHFKINAPCVLCNELLKLLK